MDYNEALRVLGQLARFGMNFGLDRIKCLMKYLGDPQEKLNIIHIGGTNGKGSTSAILSSILREAGLSTGVYTSPHLVSYTERMTINGDNILQEDFASLLEELVPIYEKVLVETGEHPTEFEVLTAMAFLYFYRKQVELVILEVGLGGHIDSTNVIKSPLLAIITNVTLDHTDYLGDTPREIAAKKAGIIKEQRPVITAGRDEAVLEVLKDRAKELGAPLYEVYREMSWEHVDEREEGQHFFLRSAKNDYGQVFLSLQGEHQMINAATAVLAAETLVSLNWRITKDQIIRGLAAVKWPGRLETVRQKPLVVIDGAHNPAGMEMLTRWLRNRRREFNRAILVIGMLADKDRAEAAALLIPLVNRVIVTRPPSSRAGDWQELGSYFLNDALEVTICEELASALDLAFSEAGVRDLVVITGSLYLIGDARRILLRD